MDPVRPASAEAFLRPLLDRAIRPARTRVDPPHVVMASATSPAPAGTLRPARIQRQADVFEDQGVGYRRCAVAFVDAERHPGLVGLDLLFNEDATSEMG